MLSTTLLKFLFLTLSLRFSQADAIDQVNLSYAQYQGYTNQTNGLTYFLGMRYAAAPVGPLRLNIPHPPPTVSGIQNATTYGSACIQQSAPSPPGTPDLAGVLLSNTVTNQGEDCLFINVIRPPNIPSNTSLPVLFWLYGGGFEVGDASQNDGTPIVERSIALGEPIIYVSINYRVNAYGFLSSKEIQAAGVGNLGLRDQRYAMEWVHENIHLFGGNKDKVTLWGESAGAGSIGFHLVTNDGNPGGLFRGAFMNSGSPSSAVGMDAGQKYYDLIVQDVGCSNASDTLQCLRGIPAKNITEVMLTKTPNIQSRQSVQLAYFPRVDGDFVKENPQDSIAKGHYAKVPFVTGDCYDEGTLFSTSQNLKYIYSNAASPPWSLTSFNIISTTAQLLDYIHQNYFPNASDADIEEIGRLYPDDPAQGSPFGTGNNTQIEIFPQYKRLAAFVGDLNFQSTRRYFIEAASKTQNVWTFKYRRNDTLAGPRFGPLFGSHHAVDALSFGYAGPFTDTQGLDAVVNFVNNLTPTPTQHNSNSSLTGSVPWPIYDTTTRSALTFWDQNMLSVTADTEREEAINGLIALARKFPVGYTTLPISAK